MKLDFKDKAQPKVGSKDNIEYKPGGGSKKVIRLIIIHNVDSAHLVELGKHCIFVEIRGKFFKFINMHNAL